MTVKPVFTTGDIASHCHVSQETVANWIRRGRLKAYATPGGHRRVRVSDLRAFLAEHDMPPLSLGLESGARRPRVLVVDDDAKIVKLLVNFLSMEGDYELASASDGFEAGIQTAMFRPDLLILDLMMPNMDGFKVCQAIRASPDTRHIRILAVTGYPAQENIDQALRSGADCCMTKPFVLTELRIKVEELLRSTNARLPEAALAPEMGE